MERFIVPVFAFLGILAGLFGDPGGQTESVTHYGKTLIESD